METLNFKTNIKCAGCIAAVTPLLNQAIGEHNWEVNVTSPDKTLTISGGTLSEDEITGVVNAAGFKAEKKS